MTQSHQVLAFAYEVDGDVVTLHIHDPNWPRQDDVTLTVEASRLRESTGEELRGVIRLP